MLGAANDNDHNPDVQIESRTKWLAHNVVICRRDLGGGGQGVDCDTSA